MTLPLTRPIRKKTCDPLFGGYAMGLLFICVGMLLGGLYFYNQSKHQHLLDTGIRTNATVVKVIESDTGRGRKRHTTCYPVVRFTDTAGHEQLIEMTTDTGAGLTPGDTVRIIYQQNTPQEMNLEQPLHMHTSSTLILTIASGICTLVGLGILGANIHQNRRFAASRTSHQTGK